MVNIPVGWLKSFWGAVDTMLPRPFTPRAQQVLALARLEAEGFHHPFVGTEHLLLGLIRLGRGVGFDVLRHIGVDLEALRLEVEKKVGTMVPNQKVPASIPYTPRVKKVLGLAVKESKALNHSYLGTEHILLGLLGEDEGVAGRVLKSLGLDTVVMKQNVLRVLDPNSHPPENPGMGQNR